MAPGEAKGDRSGIHVRRASRGHAIGASVEVDLVVHADQGFAILHDLELDHGTTGSGPVIETSGERLRALFLKGNDGTPIADRVMLLEDLCELLKASPAHPDALLQLDYKEDLSRLAPALSPTLPLRLARCLTR